MKHHSSCIIAIIICLVGLAACSRENNNGGQAENTAKLACIVTTDFYIVHFTAYLEPTAEERADRKKAFSPYCQDLPRTGKAYLTVDMLDSDVKDLPVSARVMSTPSPAGGQDLVSLAPKQYRTGIVEMVVDLAKPGEYLLELQVGAGGTDDEVLSIPLHVGVQTSTSTRLLLLTGTLLLTAGLTSFGLAMLRSRRRPHLRF